MEHSDHMMRGGPVLVGIRWGFWAGPIAWLVDLLLSYAITQHACSTGHFYVLHVITWVMFCVALSGAAWSIYLYRQPQFPREVKKDGVRPRDRAYFQMVVAVAMSVAFAIVILAGTVPRLMLSPCD